MTDTILNGKSFDAVLINIDKEDELGYWANKLKCDCEELKAVIYEVGSSLNAVRLYLRNVQAD